MTISILALFVYIFRSVLGLLKIRAKGALVKIEFLVLIKNDDSFCNSREAFINFLNVDESISITKTKLRYKQKADSEPIISVDFKVDTGNIPSNEERYFLILMEKSTQGSVDEFSEMANKIKEICKRINPESTVVNILWDDVGTHYAFMSYPLINEVENIMRKLISKFMLINVGMDWSKETIHPDLVKKIERYEGEDTYMNDLYKLDFINLSQVLFKKKRDITPSDLDRLLLNTSFDESDRNEIKKYIPKSNWEKYFSSLLDENSQGLEAKWELLYKLRNKVAHNRFLTRDDFLKIKGLSTEVKKILTIAINKLGEINLDDEDRELIINSYHNEPSQVSIRAQIAAVDYYAKRGYKVRAINESVGADLLVTHEQTSIAVEVVTVHPNYTESALNDVKSIIFNLNIYVGLKGYSYGHVYVVIIDHGKNVETSFEKIKSLELNISGNISLKIGLMDLEGKEGLRPVLDLP